MKMVFFSRNNKNNRRSFFFWGLGLSLIVIFYLGGLSFLIGPLHYVGKPLWWLKNSSFETFSNFVEFVKDKEDLLEENRNLKIKLNETISQELFYKILLEENKELKALVGRQDTPIKFILANVLVKPNLSPYDSLVLDVGKEEGVKRGDKVVFNNVIIGELGEVYPQTAFAYLYSSPERQTNVVIGFNEISGIAQGKGGGNFEMRFPKDVLLVEKDIITLPELDLFVLGAVNKIITSPEDPFQTVLFKFPINIFELKWVQILQE